MFRMVQAGLRGVRTFGRSVFSLTLSIDPHPNVFAQSLLRNDNLPTLREIIVWLYHIEKSMKSIVQTPSLPIRSRSPELLALDRASVASQLRDPNPRPIANIPRSSSYRVGVYSNQNGKITMRMGEIRIFVSYQLSRAIDLD